jgi:hypothetical protein
MCYVNNIVQNNGYIWGWDTQIDTLNFIKLSHCDNYDIYFSKVSKSENRILSRFVKKKMENEVNEVEGWEGTPIFY